MRHHLRFNIKHYTSSSKIILKRNKNKFLSNLSGGVFSLRKDLGASIAGNSCT
jgi:hypothetical protein